MSDQEPPIPTGGAEPPEPSQPPSAEDPLIAAAMRQAEGTPVSHPPSESLPFAPDMFPGYQVLREIHRGGQGVVYQAIHKTTKRKVAIKVMREGPFSGAKDLARFEREVDILVSLKHPNIVPVQDSGEVAGTFYYVMDYISGSSLEQYLASSARTVDEVLTLFAKVCDAVNAAHLKGVIHRDLKPGNVRIDAAGEPHILDFGLAKTATSDILGHSTPAVMTVTGQFIGSLFWASPEQAEGNPEKIDVRTDVYSLGVMLYHALTGRFPYQVIGNMRDVLDNILRAAPVRPSTVRRKINDEVETIVLKCLSKERDRRYQTAGELARDLKNYLTGQPIEAKRDSGWYIVRTTIRRYKAAAITAVIVLLAITAGGTASAVFWRRAEADRAVALAARAEAGLRADEATRAAAREAQARALAEASARRAESHAAFLDRTLTSIDPSIAQGLDTALMDAVLRWGVARAEHDFAGDPDVAAGVLDTIGRTYLRLGRSDDAEVHLTRALDLRRSLSPPRPESVALSLAATAQLALLRARFQESARLAGEAVQLHEPAGGAGLARCVLMLGLASRGLNDNEAARRHEERAVALARASGPAGEAVLAEALSSLGRLLLDGRDFGSAEAALREALPIAERRWGPDSIEVNTIKGNLSSLLRQRGGQGDAAAAETLAEEIVASHRRILPPDHPLLANALNKLALAREERGDRAGARAALEEALAIVRRLPPEQAADLAPVLTNLGRVLLASGEARAAEAALLEAFPIVRERYGPGHNNTRRAATLLAETYEALGDAQKAAEYRALSGG